MLLEFIDINLAKFCRQSNFGTYKSLSQELDIWIIKFLIKRPSHYHRTLVIITIVIVSLIIIVNDNFGLIRFVR